MNGENDTMYYVSKDYLGSFDVITDEQGNVLERYSFDPWGRRRNPTDWTFTDVPAPHLFDRGYTGHEHLDKFGLINMNGRVYDPWLGRFLSPDPFVQTPSYSQSYNRYSYCLNNPLKYIDPSGYRQKPFFEWEANATYYYGGGGFNGRIGPGSGNHWSDRYGSLSAIGSYTYDWTTGKYYDRTGNEVSFNEVYVNYVVPNSVSAPYGYYLNQFFHTYTNNGKQAPPAQHKPQANLLTEIRSAIIGRASMMFSMTLQELLSNGKSEFPAFSILWQNYPHDINGEHQHPSLDPYALNQCAIRLGLCLQNSGVDMKSYKTGPTTSEGYPRGAKSLADWLWKEFRKPEIMSQSKFESNYWDQTGIIFIAPPSGAAPHIDLFNCGATGSGYYLGTEIWFWKID